jgi:hypothetical protein
MLNVRRDCKIIYKAHCSRNNSIHKISLCINVHRDCKIIHKAVEEPRFKLKLCFKFHHILHQTLPLLFSLEHFNLDATLCDKIYLLLATVWLFSLGTLVSSTNKNGLPQNIPILVTSSPKRKVMAARIWSERR